MDQDERFQAIFDRVGQAEALTELPIPPELAEPSSFLKVLRARHYNWESPHFRKLFGMRFDVKIPPIKQLNAIFYPRPQYDIPIFIFFLLITKRKAIGHLNICCPFDDEEYRNKWQVPFTELLNDYAPFEANDRYPEWMKKYRSGCTVYGLYPRDREDDLTACCTRYLDLYMHKVAEAVPETDPQRLKVLADFHNGWVDDIRTQDKAQGMMAKMIGKKTARRIFYEVTT